MTEPGPMMKQLGGLEAAKRAADQRHAELEATPSEAVQAAERLKAELHQLDERFGETGERDAELEKRLLRELRDAERDLSVRAVNYPSLDGSPEIRAELVDERREAAIAGAQHAATDAESALKAFAKDNMVRVAVEVAPMAAEAKARADAWLAEGRRIAQDYAAVSGLFARLAVLAGREDLLATFPVSPFDWLNDIPRESALPVPEAFVT